MVPRFLHSLIKRPIIFRNKKIGCYHSNSPFNCEGMSVTPLNNDRPTESVVSLDGKSLLKLASSHFIVIRCQMGPKSQDIKLEAGESTYSCLRTPSTFGLDCGGVSLWTACFQTYAIEAMARQAETQKLHPSGNE